MAASEGDGKQGWRGGEDKAKKKKGVKEIYYFNQSLKFVEVVLVSI